MKSFILLPIFIVTTFFCEAQPKETANIKACFDNYKNALLDDNGSKAVTTLSKKTIDYYGDMLDKSLNADSATVDGLNLMDKLMVFSLRHRTPKDTLLSFDAKAVVVYAIQEGMISKSSVAHNTIGSVHLDKNEAKVLLNVRGQETDLFFMFYKEQNLWKLDLTSFFPMANKIFSKLIEDDGRNENDYFFYLLKMITGKEVSKNIWQAPSK